MEILLATPSSASFEAAKKVYTQGGFSKSVAEVTLSTSLTSNVSKGTQITGVNADGTEVVGKALADYAAGNNQISVQYQTLDIQSNYVGCQVGANPNPNTEGCFAPSGTLSISGEGSMAYTYDPLTDNVNGRTIQGFSTGAEAKMFQCDNCPYVTYQKFYDYCKYTKEAWGHVYDCQSPSLFIEFNCTSLKLQMVTSTMQING